MYKHGRIGCLSCLLPAAPNTGSCLIHTLLFQVYTERHEFYISLKSQRDRAPTERPCLLKDVREAIKSQQHGFLSKT